LGNGVLFYGILGIAAALFSIGAAISAFRQSVQNSHERLIYVGAVFALLHSLSTMQAAPLNFSQRKVPANDEVALTAIFNKFTRWQSIRCILQLMTFGINLAALIVYASATKG